MHGKQPVKNLQKIFHRKKQTSIQLKPNQINLHMLKRSTDRSRAEEGGFPPKCRNDLVYKSASNLPISSITQNLKKQGAQGHDNTSLAERLALREIAGFPKNGAFARKNSSNLPSQTRTIRRENSLLSSKDLKAQLEEFTLKMQGKNRSWTNFSLPIYQLYINYC